MIAFKQPCHHFSFVSVITALRGLTCSYITLSIEYLSFVSFLDRTGWNVMRLIAEPALLSIFFFFTQADIPHHPPLSPCSLGLWLDMAPVLRRPCNFCQATSSPILSKEIGSPRTGLFGTVSFLALSSYFCLFDSYHLYRWIDHKFSFLLITWK